MCGMDERSGSLFSYVDLEARVPINHPLRAVHACAILYTYEYNDLFSSRPPLDQEPP
jgi:hypothetical protein